MPPNPWIAFRIKEDGLQLDADCRKKVNVDTWYDQDWQIMKEQIFSGLTGILVQDHEAVLPEGQNWKEAIPLTPSGIHHLRSRFPGAALGRPAIRVHR